MIRALKLSILLYSTTVFALSAQPQIEHVVQNAQSGLPNWVPQIGSSGLDGVCFMDYDEDGNADLFILTFDGSDVGLTVKSSADPNIQWTFQWDGYCPQAGCDENVQFLGFYDFDGDGVRQPLIGKRNPPVTENGYTHLATFSDSDGVDVFFFGAGRVLKDIRDWDNDGYLEIIFQDNGLAAIELWGQ